MARTSSCVWRITPEVVHALDERLGVPVDSYLNGTQTWLVEPAGPLGGDTDVTLEWRLHPVAGYRRPDGLSHYDVWEQVVARLAAGAGPDALELGTEHRTLRSLWDGVECFVPYGDDVEPALLARAATDVLHVPPDAVGLVDHARIGGAWEQADGTVSIVEMLFAELHAGTTGTDPASPRHE
jgi:hypothetical protein